MQKLNNSYQENEIFMDMYQEPVQQKEQQDSLSFENDFLLPPTSYSDENKNIDNLNYQPLNYSINSFVNTSNSCNERSTNVETSQVNLFKPSTSPSDRNLQQNSTPNEQGDLQTLLDLLEAPPKKRRGRPLGSKNSDKKKQPFNNEKKAPKRKNNTSNPKPTLNSKYPRVDQQSQHQTLSPYSQIRPDNFSQTKGYSVLSQQNEFTQQSTGFIPPLNSSQQSSQFIQQPSSSKSSGSSLVSQSPGFSQLLPSSHEFSNTQISNFSQQQHSYQDYSQQLPKFSQLSASLKSPPQYSEHLGQQSVNIRSQYGPQQYDQEYKLNFSKNNPYLQSLPDYSDHIYKYSQSYTDYVKHLQYYQNYPQFYDQSESELQNFPRLIDDYNQTNNQIHFQNQRFPIQNQQIQNHVPFQKQTYIPNSMYNQISPQNQMPQYKLPQNKQSSYESNQSAENHQSFQKSIKNYQFPGQIPYETKGIYEQMKRISEYDQRIGKNMHFINGETYPMNYPSNDSQFLPSYNHILNQQLPECHSEPKFFRSWHTPENMSQNNIAKFSKNTTKLIDANSTKFSTTDFLTSRIDQLKNNTFFPTNNNGEFMSTNFLKDNNFSSIKSSTIDNTTNYPKFVSNSENLLQEKNSNFYEVGAMQYTKNIGSLPIQQNFADPLNFLDNKIIETPKEEEEEVEKLPPSINNSSRRTSKKNLEKHNHNNCQEKTIPSNGNCILSITESWVDSKLKNSENNLDTREWLLKSPAPLEIDCPENQKRKRRKYRTEYRPHKGIEHAVRRYRAKGFSTRSPLPKKIEFDPLADNNDNEFDDDDEDDIYDDEDIEEIKEENIGKRKEEDEEKKEEIKKEESDDKKETNFSQNNSNLVIKNTNSENTEKNLPTAFDIISGRWTKKNGFKKSEIHHQGLPDLQQLYEFNKTANSKQCNLGKKNKSN